MGPADIFDLISKYGPGVIFAILWYLERDERKDAQEELRKISKESIIAISEAKSTIDQLVSVFKTIGSR
jgi:hypothetical protein